MGFREDKKQKWPLHLQARSGAAVAVGRVLDTIYPPQSLLTGLPSAGGDVESELWGELVFLDEPCCAACGFPFDIPLPADTLCGACAARRPAYESARSALAYDEASRRLVLDFKHGGKTAGLRIFARHLRRAGRSILDSDSILVPVPLHPSRLRARKYNQSVLLANALAKGQAYSVDPDLLRRARKTPSQGGQSTSGRRRNVQGAFKIRKGAKGQLSGAHIVLIDDVYTTGATLEACAKSLYAGGARRVDALTLSRVVKAQTALT